jgi:hypothetical protein
VTKLDSNTNPGDEGFIRPGGWGVVNVTPSAVFQAAETYNAALASAWGYDYAVPMFIAKNVDTVTVFRDGFRSYTYEGGLWSQLLYYNTGTPPSQLYLVIRHEIGHIFWACDEYAGNCSNCDTYCENYGPATATRNGNCENHTGTYCIAPVGCIMKYYEENVCDHTARQIGWLPR